MEGLVTPRTRGRKKMLFGFPVVRVSHNSSSTPPNLTIYFYEEAAEVLDIAAGKRVALFIKNGNIAIHILSATSLGYKISNHNGAFRCYIPPLYGDPNIPEGLYKIGLHISNGCGRFIMTLFQERSK